VSTGLQPPAAQGWILKIQADPLDIEAYCGLADLYSLSGALQHADLTLRRAAEIAPLEAEVWRRLGALRGRRGDWRAAVDAYEQAVTAAPADAAVGVDFATALIAAQNLAGAESACERLLREFPFEAAVHVVAGHASKIAGDFVGAAQRYRRALELAPERTDALFNLVDLHPLPPTDPLHTKLEALHHSASLSHRDRANVCAALGRSCETTGHFPSAFTYYSEANHATRAALNGSADEYQPTRAEAEADWLVSTFDQAMFAQGLPSLEIDLRLMFVVGMPRSGTTLIEQVLGRHSRVTPGGELPFMHSGLSRLRAARPAKRTFRPLRLDDPQDRALLTALRTEYLDALMERDLDGDCVTDKLPANFAAVGLIRMLFPDATIVHVSREPIANCWSLYCSHFDQHLGYYTSFTDLAHYYNRFYRRLMRHWRGCTNLIEVSYERFVSEPDARTRELLALCDLEWDERCLAPQDSERPIFTSSLVQARRPIFASSIDRWRDYQSELSPLIEALRIP
jgi:tetratricopeptide (TPR) repeat protein